MKSKAQPKLTSNNLKHSVDADISNPIIRRSLVEAGRSSRKTIKKLLLNYRIKKQRIAWAKQYQIMIMAKCKFGKKCIQLF